MSASIDIVMPRLSDSMEEGVILKWLKAVGDTVTRGEDLVEIETDKANMTYASDTTGTLVEITATEGATLAVGEVIARIETDRDIASGKAEAAHEGDTEKRDTADTAAVAEDVGTADRPQTESEDRERVKASPLARRLANEANLDLEGLSGTGPGGRVVKSDVEAALESSTAPGGREPQKPSATDPKHERADHRSAAKGEVTVVEPSRLEQTVSRRMSESKATVPHFYLDMEVDMAQAVKLRAGLGEVGEGRHRVPTYNDMVVKAAAIALREFPRVNASYRDGRFELYSKVNVGVAVSSEDGLTVPTLLDADQKSLGEIAKETAELARRVRSGAVTPPELSGGTFTVTNLGMYGIDRFSAVINPPQAAILAIGSVRKRAVVDPKQDAIALRETMVMTLACDHRIVYGAEGAEFLARIREILEEPSALTL